MYSKLMCNYLFHRICLPITASCRGICQDSRKVADHDFTFTLRIDSSCSCSVYVMLATAKTSGRWSRVCVGCVHADAFFSIPFVSTLIALYLAPGVGVLCSVQLVKISSAQFFFSFFLFWPSLCFLGVIFGCLFPVCCLWKINCFSFLLFIRLFLKSTTWKFFSFEISLYKLWRAAAVC